MCGGNKARGGERNHAVALQQDLHTCINAPVGMHLLTILDMVASFERLRIIHLRQKPSANYAPGGKAELYNATSTERLLAPMCRFWRGVDRGGSSGFTTDSQWPLMVHNFGICWCLQRRRKRTTLLLCFPPHRYIADTVLSSQPPWPAHVLTPQARYHHPHSPSTMASVPFAPTAKVPCFTASRAYSTWNLPGPMEQVTMMTRQSSRLFECCTAPERLQELVL